MVLPGQPAGPVWLHFDPAADFVLGDDLEAVTEPGHRLQHGLDRALRGVVFFAQMAEHQAPESVRVERTHQFRGLAVAQVSIATGHPGLQAGRIGPGPELLEIVIGFQQQGLAALQQTGRMGRHHTRIRQQAEAVPTLPEPELDRFPGVMGNGKGQDLEIAETQLGTVGGKDPGSRQVAPQTPKRSRCQPDRDGIASDEDRQAPDVVGMFVGDEKGLQAERIDAEEAQPTLQFAQGETTVDQQPHTAAFDQGGVAPTAAAEGGKAHASF